MRKSNPSRDLFQILNLVGLTLLALTIFLPFINLIAVSFSSPSSVVNGDVGLWPVHPTLINYQFVFQDKQIWNAYGITIYITVVGTLLSLIMTSTLAYSLSRQEYKYRKAVLMMVMLTMIFSAPLIPTYLVIKNLHMVNTLWALMIPAMISPFNLIVMRTFFMGIPNALIDCSRIDGCGEAGILLRIILPLSAPIMATMALFYGVGFWNSYQSALYYIQSRTLMPLQIILHDMVTHDNLSTSSGDLFESILQNSPFGVQMATILVATVPILALYPFLQRFFMKGMLLGSIKE
ncbi:carbohydrate ABC transporter permease [Paenibacillus radicis (ex Xue et al. 2023)]|uniref:Carbohydrate ABC transporter permease n=1 Tax=Paenibacillus radicis (ex Xue et al. 2023) TaxID=2972489 RepID=A0ABT1YKD4_9BACL|nr:carbohydrate ABC transporter permease [Paenibacillus radicis (ex Xue et al. 2023)]MCR8633432.1 carbohydrate ABC transporter permease [Paenibacillus radicis (ex Xue et al. 2023)]